MTSFPTIRKALVIGILAGGAAAAGTPVRYTLTVTTSRAVAEVSEEIARAIGIPAESVTETVVALDAEPVEDARAYRFTFVTASQQTRTGDVAIPDVEKVGALLPGRWVEMAPATLGKGGIKRAPELAKDSEEVDYNLLAFMFFPPGGPSAALWGGVFKSAVALSYGNAVIALSDAVAQPLPAFEGDESAAADYSVVVRYRLSQETNISKMAGDALLEGVGRTLSAADGWPAYAQLDLAGDRNRDFTVFGKSYKLVDHVNVTLKLAREGYTPAASPTPPGDSDAPE